MSPSEEELVRRAVGGDESALVELLERFGVQVHTEIERSIGRQYRGLLDADDVMQVTYLEAFLRIHRFVPAGVGAFRGWLRRIAENNLKDALRALERDKRPSPGRKTQPLLRDDPYAALVEQLSASGTRVSQATARDELRQAVDAALAGLPPDYAEVLRLHELEGLAGKEVAQRMGRSHGAIRMLLARARESLAEALGSPSRFL
jgi:RNA polymerase sigma-70 factor, ECF subfamily